MIKAVIGAVSDDGHGKQTMNFSRFFSHVEKHDSEYSSMSFVTGEFNSYDDLFAKIAKFEKRPLILDLATYDGFPHITLYDDYIE